MAKPATKRSAGRSAREMFRKRKDSALYKLHDLARVCEADVYVVILRNDRIYSYQTRDDEIFPPTREQIQKHFPVPQCYTRVTYQEKLDAGASGTESDQVAQEKSKAKGPTEKPKRKLTEVRWTVPPPPILEVSPLNVRTEPKWCTLKQSY